MRNKVVSSKDIPRWLKEKYIAPVLLWDISVHEVLESVWSDAIPSLEPLLLTAM